MAANNKSNTTDKTSTVSKDEKTSYAVISAVLHNGTHYSEDEIIELTDKEAKPLLDSGDIALQSA